MHFPESRANAIGGDGQIDIVISRKRQLQSAAKTYQVFLDDKLVASLPNGGTARFSAGIGFHKLAFKGYLRIENFFNINIDGKNKEEKFYATISLKTGRIVVQEANGLEYDHVFSKQELASQGKPLSTTQLKKQSPKTVQRSASLARIDKMDGHDFEHFTADLLRKLGYEHVEVTRGSGDQGVDVIAVKDGKRYAIQCKRYGQKLGNKPVQEVFAGKTIYGCSVAVVLTNNYFTDGAKEAAKATGVELWDRDTLRRMIDYANYKAIV